MERGSRESSSGFFEEMTQDIAEEIIPADSIEQPLDASKFEHLKETPRQRAEKLQKQRENGTLPKKDLYQGFTQPVSIETAIKSAQAAAELATPTFEQPVRTKPPVKETTPVLQQVKSLFGKVGSFFKRNFGSAPTNTREVQINFPPFTEQTEMAEAKSPEAYIDLFFSKNIGLERHLKLALKGPNKENALTTFESYKTYLVEPLIQHIKNLEESQAKGGIKNQADFDSRVDQKIVALIKGHPSVQLKGPDGKPLKDRYGNILVNESLFRSDIKVARKPTVDLEPFKSDTAPRTVRIETPQEEEELKKTGTK